jgi:hypothetical protein
VSREEAATFLREIRQSITILQNYYAERKAEQQAVEQEALVSNQKCSKAKHNILRTHYKAICAVRLDVFQE